jgi:hypothetical protein
MIWPWLLSSWMSSMHGIEIQFLLGYTMNFLLCPRFIMPPQPWKKACLKLGLFTISYCSAPTGAELFVFTIFFCPWARIWSINPFDLQLKVNPHSRTPFDFYIGFPVGDSQHVINEWEPESSSAVHEFESYK